MKCDFFRTDYRFKQKKTKAFDSILGQSHSVSNSENSHQRKKIPIFFFQREKLHLFPFLFFSSFRKISISFSLQVFSPFWVFHQNFLPGFFTILAFPSKLPSRFFHHLGFPIKGSFQVFSPFSISHQNSLPWFFHLLEISLWNSHQLVFSSPIILENGKNPDGKKSEFDSLWTI